MENKTTLRYIAGTCFALVTLNIGYNLFNLIVKNGANLSIWNYCAILSALLIAISMFASMPALTIAGSALGIASNLRTIYRLTALTGIENILLNTSAIQNVFIVVFFVMLLVAAAVRNNKNVFAFIAAASYAVSVFVLLLSRYIPNTRTMLMYICYIAGAVLFGLASTENAAPAAGAYAQSAPNPYGYAQPVDNTNAYMQGGAAMNSRPAPMATGGLMAWSIITLLFCTIPGIVAIVKTSQINSALTAEQQMDTAQSAKTWCIVGTVLGVLSVIGVFAQAMLY